MKTKSIKEKIKEHYFVNPNSKMRVRELERTIKIPLPSAIRYCKELQIEGFLKTIKTGDVVFYTADRASSNFILEKKLHNIKSLYISELVDFIKRELINPVVIVFGSYAKGEDTEESDIDLYIETMSKKQLNLKEFENILNRRIQLFIHRRVQDIKNSGLSNNIINGVILNGYIEVFK